MLTERSIEVKQNVVLSSTNNPTIDLEGMGGVIVYVTAISFSPVCTVEALLHDGGSTWEQIVSYQCDQATHTKTKRAEGTSISLTARDILYIPAQGYIKVRLLYSSGTSATVDMRTCETVYDDIADQQGLTVSSISAGTNLIGKVGSPADIIQVTPTVDTGGAYTAGDIWFDTVAVSGAVANATGSGTVMGITIVDNADQAAADFWIVFLNATQSLGTVNAAPSISDANAAKILGWHKCLSSNWLDFGGCKVYSEQNLNIPIEAASGTSIGVAAITNGTPTQGNAADVVVTLAIMQNG